MGCSGLVLFKELSVSETEWAALLAGADTPRLRNKAPDDTSPG